MDNLNKGLGENGTDTIFLRTFSALILAELIHCDNKQPYLTQNEVLDVLEKALTYLLAEQRPARICSRQRLGACPGTHRRFVDGSRQFTPPER